MNSRQSIDAFLSQKRLAVVGVSRNPKDFSRMLFRDLQSRGYDLVPVHPQMSDVEGVPCRAHVTDVVPPVDGALLMTSASVSNEVVRECAAAGIRRIWMYRATGKGAVDPYAVEFCRKNGIEVVAGECPFLFLTPVGLIHRAHRFCKKLAGRYPN